MQHNLLISYLSSYLFFKITLSLSLHLSCLPLSLPLFLQTGDQCSAHLIIPEAPWALVSPVLKEEIEQHTLLHTSIHTDPLKSINARLALVLADLIFWVNRAMQTWLSVRSHDNEQSLISPQRRPPSLNLRSYYIAHSVALLRVWFMYSGPAQSWETLSGTKWDRLKIFSKFSLIHPLLLWAKGIFLILMMPILA